ncbi:hypothetical protein HDK64DRAFT_318460 [Phyllosticta capitalensis]
MVQNTASSTDESRPDREEGMSMSEIGITMLKWLRSFPLVVVVEELVARVRPTCRVGQVAEKEPSEREQPKHQTNEGRAKAGEGQQQQPAAVRMDTGSRLTTTPPHHRRRYWMDVKSSVAQPHPLSSKGLVGCAVGGQKDDSMGFGSSTTDGDSDTQMDAVSASELSGKLHKPLVKRRRLVAFFCGVVVVPLPRAFLYTWAPVLGGQQAGKHLAQPYGAVGGRRPAIHQAIHPPVRHSLSKQLAANHGVRAAPRGFTPTMRKASSFACAGYTRPE